MTITLNAEPRELPDGVSVGSLVDEVVDGGRRGVAVAVNGVVVRRADWDATALSDDDRVELLVAAQGG